MKAKLLKKTRKQIVKKYSNFESCNYVIRRAIIYNTARSIYGNYYDLQYRDSVKRIQFRLKKDGHKEALILFTKGVMPISVAMNIIGLPKGSH